MLTLRKMTIDDLPLFKKWLFVPHVSRWYHDPEDWISEVENADGAFDWVEHFIVETDGRPFGFCQYYAFCNSGEDWLEDSETEGTYSIDYLIGDPDALRRGYGKQIVAALTEKISAHKDARRIAVQPEKENAASRALLQSCGFSLVDAQRGVFLKELSHA